MFSGFKREEGNERSKLDAFKEEELDRVMQRYLSLPETYVKSRNDLLQSILLIEGKGEVVRDVNIVKELHNIKYEIDDINKKLDELLKH